MAKKWYARIDVSARLTGQWVKIGIVKTDDQMYKLIASNGDPIDAAPCYTIDGALNTIDRMWSGRAWNLEFI